MKVQDIINLIERNAPLNLQEEWDNSGLQLGSIDDEVTGVLVALDITEDVVDEAISGGYSMIVSHHPLLFRGLKQVADVTYQQRCVRKAILSGISIYSAHTSLDNAEGGVNWKIAEKIGFVPEGPLEGNSGVIGNLSGPVPVQKFLEDIRSTFGVECLRYGDTSHLTVQRVALCGGAGAFLSDAARRAGADCFITGEFHYHDYFDAEGMLLVEMGHYQSEQFTQELLAQMILSEYPSLRVSQTSLCTNATRYLK